MTEAALRALLTNVIDYAGLYPPAALPLPEVLDNYERYRGHWMMNRLVLPLSKLTVKDGWRVTLLVEAEPGPLPPQVETLETKTPGRLSLPTYCEVPLSQMESGYAKIRTAGIPAEALADFLHTAAARRIPFKATAGLHHPIRTATEHGFLNVFIAAAFAWQRADRAILLAILNDTDLGWRNVQLTMEQIQAARRDFAHSFGSCSFEEPLTGLESLL